MINLEMKIFDTHAHLFFGNFDDDVEETVERCQKGGVKAQIQIGCDEVSSMAALNMAKKFPNFYASIGVHPSDVLTCWDKPRRFKGLENYEIQAKNLDEFFVWAAKITEDYKDKIVGFGETGFDLYHDDSPEIFEEQKKAFAGHLELAKKFDKVLIIHNRDAADETLNFLRKNVKRGDVRGVIHCFCEGPEFAKEIIEDFGFYIGIGGVATYKNAQNVRDAIAAVPLEYIVTETDAPFLTPFNFRKKFSRNEPTFLSEVIELIAEIKDIPVEECAEVLFENAKRLFQIKT